MVNSYVAGMLQSILRTIQNSNLNFQHDSWGLYRTPSIFAHPITYRNHNISVALKANFEPPIRMQYNLRRTLQHCLPAGLAMVWRIAVCSLGAGARGGGAAMMVFLPCSLFSTIRHACAIK